MKINKIITAAILFSTASIASAQTIDGNVFRDFDADGTAATTDVEWTITVTDTEATTDNEHKDWIIIESMSSPLFRNADTGEVEQKLVIKRATDESSPALVRAFLDGTVIDRVQAAEGEPRSTVNQLWGDWFIINATIVSYSQTIGGVDDGMEEFTFVADSFSFGVEREMKESGEKGGTEEAALLLPAVQAAREAAVSRAHDDPDTDVLPEPEPLGAAIGGDGVDVLRGGAGNDTLLGDANLDRVVGATDLNSNAASAHIVREVVPDGVALKRKEEALHHLRKAYDLNPNDLSIKVALGRALPNNRNQLWGDWF